MIFREIVGGKWLMSSRSRVFRYKFYQKQLFRELIMKADLAELIIEPHDEDFIDLSGMVLGGQVSDVIVDHEESEGRVSIYIRKKNEVKFFDIKVKMRIPITRILDLLGISLDVGDIRVDGLPVKKMYLYTANGDIMIGGVSAEDIKLESINGDIYVRGGEINNLNISSTNGDLRMEIHLEKSRFVAEDINGEIRLLITENSNAFIEATTINGIIKVFNKEKIKMKSEEEKFFQGLIGEGESEVVLKTVNGNIRIEILKKMMMEEK